MALISPSNRRLTCKIQVYNFFAYNTCSTLDAIISLYECPLKVKNDNEYLKNEGEK